MKKKTTSKPKRISKNQPTSPTVALFLMTAGYYLTNAIHVAAKLRIADALDDGDKTSEELAKITQTHAPSLHRLMRVLANAGVFAERKDQTFGLTPLGRCLRSGAPDSFRAGALMFAGERLQRSWSGGLLHSIR